MHRCMPPHGSALPRLSSPWTLSWEWGSGAASTQQRNEGTRNAGLECSVCVSSNPASSSASRKPETNGRMPAHTKASSSKHDKPARRGGGGRSNTATAPVLEADRHHCPCPPIRNDPQSPFWVSHQRQNARPNRPNNDQAQKMPVCTVSSAIMNSKLRQAASCCHCRRLIRRSRVEQRAMRRGTSGTGTRH